MSHFPVVVCIDDPSKLEAVLAPFDENLEVDEYRAYEEGLPQDYWAVPTFREQGNLNSDDTTLTWAQIAEVHNLRWSDDPPMRIDENGRAYCLSTDNPKGKWDYWRIGGRWGGFFTASSVGDPRLFRPERAWDSPDVLPKDSCDGGPKELLDLDGMRERAASKARDEYEKWAKVVECTPEARPWREFADMIGVIDGYTREQAQLEYRTQPRMVALEGTDFAGMWDCPIAAYQKPERVFVELARANAVPGFAVVTVEGKWMAPGEMGWFGCSTDTESQRIGYLETANAYIDSLPDSTYLIAVDCHV